MRRATLTAAEQLLALQSQVLAQESGVVQPGSRVRVSHHCTETYDPGERREQVECEEQTGTVASVNSDSLVLDVNNEGTFASIPLGTVSRLQLSTGRGGAGTRGAAYGALAGAGLGIIFGIALCNTTEGSTNSPGACALGGAALVAIPGAVLGLMLAHSLGREGWVDVPVEAIALSVGSAGVGIGISVQF